MAACMATVRVTILALVQMDGVVIVVKPVCIHLLIGTAVFRCLFSAKCLSGCSRANGYCLIPETCTCNTGWQGTLCDQRLVFFPEFNFDNDESDSAICGTNCIQCSSQTVCTLCQPGYIGSSCNRLNITKLKILSCLFYSAAICLQDKFGGSWLLARFAPPPVWSPTRY